MPKIERIIGREILDSRGVPTVEAVVVAGSGVGLAKVPAGTSTGIHEARELRDGDESRFDGQGVLKAVGYVNGVIREGLVGQNTANQSKIDNLMLEMDGTPNKSKLGANAILAVSMAVARAEAAAGGIYLYKYLEKMWAGADPVMPVPQMNLINGGKHASNNLSIQEFQVLPMGSPSFSEALRMGVEIYHQLAEGLAADGYPLEVGLEGGFAPRLDKSELVFNYLIQAMKKAGYVPGVDAWLGIDAAASEFYNQEADRYELDGESLSAQDLAFRYQSWQKQYPLISIEDPFAEDKWDHWVTGFKKMGRLIQIVGDDLYATNTVRIEEGARKKAANAVLIKLNQVGTLTETLAAIRAARDSGQNIVISHRSGETEDAFIADLSVAVSAGQVKMGAPSRSDRTAKYNRLLMIEDDVGENLSHDLQRFLEKIRSRA